MYSDLAKAILLFLFSFSIYAKNASFNGEVVDLAKVKVGGQNYSAKMVLIPNSSPLKFEVTEAVLLNDPIEGKSNLQENVLEVHAVNIGDTVFKANLRLINSEPIQFELETAAIIELPETPQPKGLYVLSPGNSIDNIRDYDFVEGYTLRPKWDELEIGLDQYDFSTIEAALAQLEAIGKFLTLEVRPLAMPIHMANQIQISWSSSERANTGAPWDQNFINNWRRFNQVMADHTMILANGSSVRLADHPNFKQMSASIVGISGIRDTTGTLVQLPDYTRDKFLQSIFDSVYATIDVFPKQHHFIAVFKMDDNNVAHPLDEAIVEKLMEEFNADNQPTLGLFQELLSDVGPNPETLGKILVDKKNSTYIMFQALSPWTGALSNTRDKVASGSPAVGIELAYENYNSRYVELYIQDIDNPALFDQLREWNQRLTAD